MAEIILKDWYNKEKTFNSDRIFVKGTDGELIQFTEGTGDAPAVVQPLEVTENGTYTSPDGVDGYSPVTVAVPEPEINLQDKTITENGTYTADSGYDGLGSVTVEVAGSGGGSLPAGCYWKLFPKRPDFYVCKMFFRYGKVHFWTKASTSDTKYDIYVYENGAYTQIATDIMSVQYDTMIEYNGMLHIISEVGNHYMLDENWSYISLTTHNYGGVKTPAFIMDGELYKKDKTNFYKWIEASDTWEAVTITNCPTTTNMHWLCVHNRNVFIVGAGTIYKVDWDAKTCTTVATGIPSSSGKNSAVVCGDYIFFHANNKLYKYDINENVYELVDFLPHYIVELYVNDGHVCVSGTTTNTSVVHMELHEVTE